MPNYQPEIKVVGEEIWVNGIKVAILDSKTGEDFKTWLADMEQDRDTVQDCRYCINTYRPIDD